MKSMYLEQSIRKSSVCFVNSVDCALFQFHEESTLLLFCLNSSYAVQQSAGSLIDDRYWSDFVH